MRRWRWRPHRRTRSGAAIGDAIREFVAVDAPVVALVNARVIDGTGAPARPGQTLIVRQGTIEAIGSDGEHRRARGRPHHRPGRQERDPRPGDGARAPLLPDRARRVRPARAELRPALPRRRRHDHPNRRQPQRLHGHHAEAPGRGRRGRRTGHRRDHAVRERPQPVRPDDGAARPRSGRAGTSATGPTRAPPRSRPTCRSPAPRSARRSARPTPAA